MVDTPLIRLQRKEAARLSFIKLKAKKHRRAWFKRNGGMIVRITATILLLGLLGAYVAARAEAFSWEDNDRYASPQYGGSGIYSDGRSTGYGDRYATEQRDAEERSRRSVEELNQPTKYDMPSYTAPSTSTVYGKDGSMQTCTSVPSTKSVFCQ